MPSVKTNFIRTQIQSQCFRYEFQLISNQPVDPKYHHQIQEYFISFNAFIVFSYPYVFSTQELRDLKSFNFMLSNGQKTHVSILIHNTITLNSKQIPKQIHRQLMKGTNFLYSQNLNIWLNPFEQRKINYTTSLMPGFSIHTQQNNNCIGFYLIPIQAKINQFHSLSTLHQHSIILDYNSGTFYQKSTIVRYDKQNEIIHFRTGQQIKKQYLKALQILPLSGFELASRLNRYYERIRGTQRLKQFINKWVIKFDSRFMELPYNFFPVSHIIMGNKQQKSLGQTIGSISAYNFQHNFRRMLTNCVFDENMRANIYFLLPQIYKDQQQISIDIQDSSVNYYNQLVCSQYQLIEPIISQLQNLKQRMKLTQCKIIILKYDIYVGWANNTQKIIKQIKQIVQKQNVYTCDKIFVLNNIEEVIKQEIQQLTQNVNVEDIKPIYKDIVNHLVQNGNYYHLINFKENDFKKANDLIAIKTLATLQTKLRFNPWKIKDIPFGTKPLMTISLHVKQQTNQTITISIVASLNAFLSKYTCLSVNCTIDKYAQTIINLASQCLIKFNSIHKIYPKRAMIFRTGDCTQSIQQQYKSIQQKLLQSFACKPTIILLSAQSPLRVYNQLDFNYVSKDTVKPTQLLCQIKYNNERYIQLESDSPMYKINILGIDYQQVNFQQKVIQLMTKLCFTYQIMVQMKYAKGLGFINYGQKLYNWSKQFNHNIKGMQNHLKQGLLMFL